ncbi:phosphotyrosine-specific ptp2-like protein [Ceratocystis pirilliformis]|uniref:protein-tyrosine-phosphatase n=1 Tax=Ceratocystis pirilliformis TaxID=259994 RepID=A0ABR3YXP7_9PEZI
MQFVMTTSPRHTPAGHPIHDALCQTRTIKTPPATASSHTAWGEPFSTGQALPPPNPQNGHGATTTDVNSDAANANGRSSSPNYFGLVINNSDENTTSSLAAGIWEGYTAANKFHPSSDFTAVPTATATATTATTAAISDSLANAGLNPSNQDMTTARLPRPSFQHNVYQSQAGPEGRPPIARFNTMPSTSTGIPDAMGSSESTSSSTNSSAACSPLNRSAVTIATSTTSSIDRVKIPRSAMPSFAYSSIPASHTTDNNTVTPSSSSVSGLSNAKIALTPMDIDESPFFINTAPAMNLSMPSGRGFSQKDSLYPRKTPAAAAPVNHPHSMRPSLSLQLNVAGSSIASSAVSRGTLTPALVSGKNLPGQDQIVAHKLKDLIEDDESQILLLDVRCSQNYSNSHIRGALNLCIPTMLLKRDNFRLKKVLQSFQRPGDIEKLSNWRNVKTIVAYGACSSDKNEVSMASNVLQKFIKEGFTGLASVLTGGFSNFIDEHPDYVVEDEASSCEGDASASSMGGPIFGGVTIPQGEDPVQPFFSTIRQNADLVDGVGQTSIQRPSGVETRRLPAWLDKASNPDDSGKKVSEKFLKIECSERDRMRSALSVNRSGVSGGDGSIRLSGFEKGSKNRYKDVLPFDHARVKLHGKVECDYINASHIKSSRSNKRYIASQGPLPSTCDDFWSVIWDQDIRLIVNLTSESERGHTKCHAYWTEKRYGPVSVKLVTTNFMSLDLDKLTRGDIPAKLSRSRARANTTMSFETNPNVSTAAASTAADDESTMATIRYFAISHSNYPWQPIREVVQLHYSGWPDFGAPTQPAHLLALVEMANILNRQLSHPEINPNVDASVTWQDEAEMNTYPRPILVHCSAGCGRTGTFCTVDSVIDMMKRQRLASMDILGGRAPADTAATAVAAAMGINAPNSPRSSAAAMRSISAVFGSPTSAVSRQRSNSSSRRGSSVAMPVTYPPIDTTWMGDESIDLISATVDDFRKQRISMVQTLKQYALCYEAVMEWISRLNDQRPAGSVVGSRIRPRQGSVDGH